MRPHRIRDPGFFFHVTARGNNRQDIFLTDADKLDYLGRITDIFSSRQIRMLTYCLMTNHLHLLVQDVKGGGLIEAMRRLHGAYAQAWNCTHRRSGHVFGERYHPEVVKNEAHLIIGSCYIHNNCVAAGMVGQAADYRWSSVRSYLGGTADIPVSTDLILDLCGGPKKYAELLNAAAEIPSTAEEHLPAAERVREIWASGSVKFRERVETLVERRSDRRRRVGRPEGLTLEELWRKVHKLTGVDRGAICGATRERRISQARALLCVMATREGIPAVEVAHVLRRTTSSVVHLAKRFARKAAAVDVGGDSQGLGGKIK